MISSNSSRAALPRHLLLHSLRQSATSESFSIFSFLPLHHSAAASMPHSAVAAAKTMPSYRIVAVPLGASAVIIGLGAGNGSAGVGGDIKNKHWKPMKYGKDPRLISASVPTGRTHIDLNNAAFSHRIVAGDNAQLRNYVEVFILYPG